MEAVHFLCSYIVFYCMSILHLKILILLMMKLAYSWFCAIILHIYYMSFGGHKHSFSLDILLGLELL